MVPDTDSFRETALAPRPLTRLPTVESMADLLHSDHDAIHYPRLTPPSPPRTGWLDPDGRPYIIALNNPVFYPRHTLPSAPVSDALAARFAFRDLGLLAPADGSLYPDSFNKSRFIPTALIPSDDGPWRASLPDDIVDLPGTWLFAELFYAHFGHTLVDMPARLWPLADGMLRPDEITGVIGQGMLGTGQRGQRHPGYATQILQGMGLGQEQIRFAHRPIRIERLIVPRRIAPYKGLWNPVFSRLMRQAGERITRDPGTHHKVWLSRSGLKDDPRAHPSLALLDEIFAAQGFEVVHPQELPLAQQISLMQGATHIAGPVGSQTHLCAFATTPGVRLLTIGPSYFKIGINEKLLQDIGGARQFLLQRASPKDLPNTTPWAFEAAERPALEAVLHDWI
jgi:capsular polysaccharide biosynthesis protein